MLWFMWPMAHHGPIYYGETWLDPWFTIVASGTMLAIARVTSQLSAGRLLGSAVGWVGSLVPMSQVRQGKH